MYFSVNCNFDILSLIGVVSGLRVVKEKILFLNIFAALVTYFT